MLSGRRGFLRNLAGTGLGLSISDGTLQSGQGGAVHCRVVDARTGQPTVARIRLLDGQGREVVPAGHPENLPPDAHEGDVSFQSRRFAYVDGGFEIDPARLPLRYQVIKGYEYVMAEGELKGGGAFTIPLSRWSSIADRGWYSGDIHIHYIAPKTCRLEMEGEDLNVANILTTDVTTDQDQFEGRLNPNSGGNRLVYVNQEFRNDQLGHMCLLNMKKLIEPVKTMQHEHWPLHMDVCDKAHAQGAYVSWAHFPSWPGVESPLDVAMEKLDGLEIMSQLEPRDFPVFMKQVVPEMPANTGLRLWYRFLNCGFRLTATAGTDKMTTFVTVGANRVFARLDGPFTYENWIRALRAGRTFVTNSPILNFTVNGLEPGATVRTGSKPLQIRASAESQLPYDRLEIIVNGEVVADATPSGPHHHAGIKLEYPPAKSCWIAARAHEDVQRYRARGLDFSKVHVDRGTILSDHFGTRRPETVFAHSSPVYVIRDGAPIRNWDDAQYYVRYLKRSIEWLKTGAKFARPSDQKSSIEAFERGIAIYERRAREAKS